MNTKKIIFALVLLVNTLSKAGDYVSAEITVQDTTTMPIGGGSFPFLVQNISDVPMNINIWGQGWITIDAGVGVPTPRNLGSSGALYSVKVQRADNTGNIAELSGFDDLGWHQLFISLSADGKTPLLYLTASSGSIVGQGGWLAGIPRYFPTSTGVTLTNASTIATSAPTPTHTPVVSTPTPTQLNNQLIAAVRANNSSQVQALLQQGANPNALDENGNSAIANAASRGYVAIINVLKAKGADKTIAGSGGQNACYWALNPIISLTVAQQADVFIALGCPIEPLCEKELNTSSLTAAQESLTNLTTIGTGACSQQITSVNNAIQLFQAPSQDITCLCLWKPGQMADAPLMQTTAAGQNPCDLCQTACDGALKTSTPLVGYVPGHYGAVTAVPWTQWKQCRPAAAVSAPAPAPTSTPTPTPVVSTPTPTQLNNQLIAAVRANNSSQVQALLQQGANPNALDENGNSAIANAASRGYVAVINVLKAKGADKAIAGPGGQNACYWALNPIISLTVAQQADVFIALGCPIEPLCEKELNTSSLAAAQESLTNLTTIGTGACSQQITSVNNAIQSFPTLAQQLIAAVRANNGSQVQTLLQQGANPNALDEHNNSAIANAAARGYLSIVETLKNAGGFKQDPNACTWALKAPGGIVAQAQLINALQICNSQVGTLCNSQVNINSLQTAQDSLVNLRHIQSVNANFCVAQIDQVNTAIANPPQDVTCLCLWKPGQMAEAPLMQTTAANQNPCDLCQTACDGALKTSTPLVGYVPGHYGAVTAVPWTQWKQCRPAAAVSAPAPAPTPTPTPTPVVSTPTPTQLNNQLIAAVRANNSSQVQALLQQGANPNALDENGNSAIANAASRGYVAVINVLKAKGADKAIAGPGGQNACYWALNPIISLTVAQQADVFIALGCPIEPLCEKELNTSSLAAAQESLTNLTTIGTGACSQQITSVNNAIQSLTRAAGLGGFIF